MTRPRVKLNLAGIRELKRAPGVAAFMRECAEPVADVARANAPVDTGEYRDSIDLIEEIHPTSGAVVHVVATDDKALVIESRTGNLARALDAAGGS